MSFTVDELTSFEWSSQEAVAYEAAVEAINEVRALYTGLIAREQTTAQPDEQRIAAWTRERSACAQVTRSLDPADRAQVATVRRDYTARAVQLREEHG